MKTCVFFGHRNAPMAIKPAIRREIVNLIETAGVDRFLVGHNGAFDRMVLGILREVSQIYRIEYAIVLERPDREQENWKETLLPEGLERVPPKFALWHRNKWMVEQSDFLIAYVHRSFGGAAQFTEMARKKNKTIIHIKE